MSEVRDLVAMAAAAGVALWFVAGLVVAQLRGRGQVRQIPLVLLTLLAVTAVPVAMGLVLFAAGKPAFEGRGMSPGYSTAVCLALYLAVVAVCVGFFVCVLRGALGAPQPPAPPPVDEA